MTAAFAKVTRSTPWQLAERIPLRFATHHPPGFALAGDKIFMSSVEIIEAPVKYPEPVDGYDRTPGKGVGHVFVMDRDGNLLRDITVGAGTIYHPGGIDFDGRYLWVPVAEYRPDSASVIYRIDVRTYEVSEVHGVSWGSRTEYTWTERAASWPNSQLGPPAGLPGLRLRRVAQADLLRHHRAADRRRRQL